MTTKRVIMAMVLAAACTMGVKAQTASQDPDSLYTKTLLKAGDTAPQFEMLKSGKWTVIDFWATWCPDCRREVPTMKEMYEKYGATVNFVGVSFDTDRTKLDKYCQDNGVKWPQYCEQKKWKDTQISKDYGIGWLPTMYLISPDGKVAYTTVLAERMAAKLSELK